ncbi:hypothetical protein NY048_09160 [Corynebacterium diphtheriae bv. gravis]|nr:hypothetical protein NY048_09160 [Corynebacterium diphtheriae bv. gravis]UWF53662.1 hypothetical protein NY050_00440 [Corynebacterium diphtheriae bv. gravis]
MTDMSDSFSFIDDFLRDLEEFGTGSYLRADEKEFWDPPFDVSALPELKKGSCSVCAKHGRYCKLP